MKGISMNKKIKPVVILLADDDDDDALLTEKALKEYHIINEFHRVKDGEELLDYLLHRGDYKELSTSPKPALIMLDLNMPKMDGREALDVIKKNPDLRSIPITILTTSEACEDIVRSYDLGVNSFITKPVELKKFIEVVQRIEDYWFQVVQLPDSKTLND